MFDRARLIPSFAFQQLLLISVVWGEAPYGSWGERCSRAASQGPGARTGGRSPCPCFCSLTKGLCPSQLLLRGASARSWGRRRGEMKMLPPFPSPAQ